jgi:hypothetical protein
MSTSSAETVVPDRPRHSFPAVLAGWAGIVGQLATLVWYMASGLIAPGWAVIGLLATWLVLFGVAIYLLRKRPAWVLAVPVAAALIWFGVMAAGEAWLGWTA